ncbi:hypothetical protein [Mameliella alba]|uniref:Uncharacterized protein n=2 Tax=Mameliella TaxID=1434019 RepID=A0A0B3RL82_9RHOB|nr:hypothetical protein [Mameliella alba]KHQ51980.1 hypothetical protein OA50_03619 [Mameliella alba]MBY6121033.1 hypothetical protein [Mameliella alba]OWV41992.1 hypothetical protein CDZ95_15660 [Mameliella alba]OWV56796.1 hypothetical protein CDZ98_17420 [Mameliella alba]OWV62274.1 hypothetical protein CDZ97_16035 [Mameliella alba]
MVRRALRIWLMHSLAFLAGLVVSGVVAVGLWFVVPTEGGNALFVGSALAVSIVSVGTGYAVYLALLAALLDLLPGWGFYLGGPLVVLAVMTLVFCAVYFRMLAAGAGSLLGYALMFGIGGIALHLRLRGDEPRAETGDGG